MNMRNLWPWVIFAFLLTACGVVRQTGNPVADAAIKIVDEYYPQDNILEEKTEELIESTTGVDLDLSPATPEIRSET